MKTARNSISFLNHPKNAEHRSYDYSNTTDYLFLHELVSVKSHLRPETVSLSFFLVVSTLALVVGLSALFAVSILVSISAILAVFYLAIMLFKVVVTVKAMGRNPFIHISAEELHALDEQLLPRFSVVIPLYQEAVVIPHIMRAMTSLDYPVDKLEVIITLEQYDHETIDALNRVTLPQHFRLLYLPDVKPKTKPKALNVAFNELKGEYVVIYDAEIVPESTQLKKAAIAFSKHPDVACLQTRLDHYNAGQNIVTRLFNAEFSFYYDMFLPGLQKLGYPIPLSGHSTFFRRRALADVGAWDPYNVTEDCDVGIRLYRFGHKVAILDSISHEEATSSVHAWVLQRARWMKGFVQTSIVHLRHPLRFMREIGGPMNFLSFLFTIPGTVFLNLINMFYLVLLLAWFTTHSPIIQSFFPGPILYIAMVSFMLGNFMFIYLNLLGAYKRKRFSLVKYSLLSPLYWVLLSVATVYGLVELVSKPHHWEKTKHGSFKEDRF